MGQYVCNGAMLQCTFGAAPSTLTVLPTSRVMVGGMPAATIMDFAPMVNIMPFAMCTAPTNPAVISAMGSPVPCVPVVPAPWTPGNPQTLIGGMPALNSTSKCMCTWAGMISISMAGQFTVQE